MITLTNKEFEELVKFRCRVQVLLERLDDDTYSDELKKIARDRVELSIKKTKNII